MEADEYFQAIYAIQQDARKSRMSLRIGNPCAVTTILWSSFDYMSGPEQRFVWDVSPSNDSVTPPNLSGDDEPSGSGADDESLDSSMTNSSVQFEEIDDVLQDELSIVVDGDMNLSQFMDDFMTESRASEATNTTLDALTDSFVSHSLSEPRIPFDDSTDSFQSMKAAGGRGGLLPPSSSSSECLVATPVVERNHSLFPPGDNLSRHSTVTVVTADEGEEGEEGHEGCSQLEEDNIDLMTSGYVGSERMVDSADFLQGLSSPYHILSPAGPGRSSEEETATPFSLLRPHSSSSFDSNADEYLDDVTLDTQEDAPTDEQFVTKFVLAEQICSTQLPSNPLLHKLTLVPTRRLLVASFLFASTDDSKTMQALSLLMHYKRSEWYMQRQEVIEGIFTDIVPRVKASLIAEDWDESIVRLTGEFSRMLSFLGTLDRFPLLPPSSSLKIKRTFFGTPSIPSAFASLVAKSISACLQTLGNVVVFGTQPVLVSRLLHTLLLFVPPSLRWQCQRPAAKADFCPYGRLQTLKKSSLSTFLSESASSHWPWALIDVDRSVVVVSAPFHKHRILKKRTDLAAVNSILGRPTDSTNRKIDLSRCPPLPEVTSFLRRMAMLPVEDSARLGFVEQFNLCVENEARAFIAYVKDASLPSEYDKSHASRSASFSLPAVRKALDLNNEGWFSSVLARAESLQPEISQFVYM